MDVFDADILKLWKCLQKNEVRYIMIGGFATKYAVIAEIEWVRIRFLRYNHLITCKKASGRLQDLLDIEELEKIRNASGGNNI